jgi:hypothetical protein
MLLHNNPLLFFNTKKDNNFFFTYRKISSMIIFNMKKLRYIKNRIICFFLFFSLLCGQLHVNQRIFNQCLQSEKISDTIPQFCHVMVFFFKPKATALRKFGQSFLCQTRTTGVADVVYLNIVT